MSLEGHDVDEDGDHDEDACYQCLLKQEVKNDCRCGVCCRRLLVETTLEDARREPKIAERGSPLKGFSNELIGYLLNGREDMACVFLDQGTNCCTIYETRPLVCRLFDCEGEGREQLIELGIMERE
jgi:Fe-S-cluster containining protein